MLVITPYQILFAGFAIMLLYISAIMILIKHKAGFLPYLTMFVFPIVGALAIVLRNTKSELRN